MVAFPQGHALVIGVGAYADARWDVPVATADAQALAAALTDGAQGGYAPGQVELITGAAATRSAILAALRRLSDRVGPDDTVLISFTGHGAPGSDAMYYLGTYDMAFDGQRITTKTGLGIADLGLAIREIRSERVLLLLNACFAGTAAPALASGGIAPPPQIGAVLSDAQRNELLRQATAPSGAGRAIITASRPDQLSRFVTDRDRSFFGQALLDALAGGDGSSAPSGVIGLFELYTFLHRQVPLMVRNGSGEAQEPMLTLLQGLGNFAVAAYRGGSVARPEQLMPTLPGNVPLQQIGRDQIIAQPGSTVQIDNRQEAPLISFGANSSVGDIRTGDLARGDIIKTYLPGSNPPTAEPDSIEPATLLPRLAREIGQANNVDVDLREEIAATIELAAKAFARNDTVRTLKLIQEALEQLAPLRANGYINSRARKLEQVRTALTENR